MEAGLLTIILAVHDASIVEHHVDASPFVNTIDNSFYFGLLGDVALHDVNVAGHVWRHVLGFRHSFVET